MQAGGFGEEVVLRDFSCDCHRTCNGSVLFDGFLSIPSCYFCKCLSMFIWLV